VQFFSFRRKRVAWSFFVAAQPARNSLDEFDSKFEEKTKRTKQFIAANSGGGIWLRFCQI
jgi:hypothetical protein